MHARASRRSRFVSGVGAALGLAAALVAGGLVPSRPGPAQLPGFAVVNGFSPRGSVLRLLLFAALPVVGGALGAIAAGRTRRPVAGGPLLAAAAAAHALLVWTFLLPASGASDRSALALLLGLAAGSLGLAAVLGRGDPARGAAFLAAACPLLPLALLANRPPAFGLRVAAAGWVLPVLARALSARVPGLARWLRAATVFALLPGSLTAMAAAAMMQAPRVVDVFEDGHALLPASEYLRGELPYRDILPGHGLASDGALAAVALRLFGDDYRGVKRGEKVWGAFFWPALYAIGYAATGSPAFGFGGLLYSFVFFPQYQSARPIASLWILALALYAARSKSGRAWIACGAALPVCLCVTVEYSFYAACGVAVALWVARGRRVDHLRRLVAGAAAAGAVLAAAFGAAGILGGFLFDTFVFVPSLLPVYAQGFPPTAIPETISRAAAMLGDDQALLYAFVVAGALLLGALLPRAPRVGPRARALAPVLAWAIAAMLSVLERRHVGYPMVVVPVGLLLMARLWAGRRPFPGPRVLAAAAGLTVLALPRRPILLLLLVAQAIVHRGWHPDTIALAEPPRARGGLFKADDARVVAATERMLRAANLGPDETWLDFANAPGLYYLFDRDCPIRYYEPGFYESESAQREVIEAVARDLRVRAVLVSSPYGAIDGVPNTVRAPRVARFIEDRFRPFFREGEVEFWLRKSPEAAVGPGPDPRGAERRESSAALRP